MSLQYRVPVGLDQPSLRRYIQWCIDGSELNMLIPVRRRSVSDAVRVLSNMAPQDYVDFFTATAPTTLSASPDYWARAVIEDAGGLGGQFIWRILLGLRLDSSRASDQVGGWRIAERSRSFIRLEAASSFLTVHIIIAVEGEDLSMATFLRYDRPLGSFVWSVLSAVHRKLMPRLLRSAIRLGSAGLSSAKSSPTSNATTSEAR
jgi:hypothetical protein